MFINLRKRIHTLKDGSHLAATTVIEAPKSQKELIQEIHDLYDNAVNNALEQAKNIIEEAAKADDVSKGKRLITLGFVNSIIAKKSQKIIEEEQKAKELATRILHYQQRYPGYKFITREMVAEINKKYSLVCGSAELYKGDIPEKNIKDIENFPQLDENDKVYRIEFFNKYRVLRNFLPKEELNEWEGGSVSVKEEPFYISAPQKEMLMNYTTRLDKDGFIVEDDPIVLKPVNGGFLIVTKWGLEANDQSLVNEKLN